MSLSESSHTPSHGAIVHQLKIKTVFDALDQREKFYAHFLERTTWHGSRIIMRQVWKGNITFEQLASLLEYAAMFLCNLGNFYVSGASLAIAVHGADDVKGEGDQKFVPEVTAETLRKMAAVSLKTKAALDKVSEPLLAILPFSLGYPCKNTQSGYNLSNEPIAQDEIANVSEVMKKLSVGPEKTRVRKMIKNGTPVLQLLQASAETAPLKHGHSELGDGIYIPSPGRSLRGMGQDLLLVGRRKRVRKQRQNNPGFDTLHRDLPH
ncbi:hypothetical protein MMC25_004149 [Agyrium rufum]|nr:hypothetical protein [Agyrium rufum]